MKKLILSIFAILYWWNISAQCPQGNIIFSTQQEVDDFAASYPGCMEVSGNLIIGTSDVSSDIHDLSPFYQITSIEGNLTIADNDSLISISDWQSLESIGGNITIIDNRHLADLPNLIEIDSIQEGLIIQNNVNLRSLTGLENITSIERLTIHSYYSTDFEGLKNLTSLGRLSLSGLFISDISALKNLTSLDELTLSKVNISDFSPLQNLTEIPGGIYIYQNNAMSNFSGLENVTSMGCLSVNTSTITDLTGLENLKSLDILNLTETNISDLSALQNLTEIRSVSITRSHAITNLSGLENITNLEGGLWLSKNNKLADLTALSNVTNIGGSSTILNQIALTSLNGLNNVQSFGTLYIENNKELTSLSALANVDTINELRIRRNVILTNLNGLSDVEYFGELRIDYNFNLSVCDVQSICNHIHSGREVIIAYNDPGCNSIAEVKSACPSPPTCPSGNVTLSTQNDIDNFQILYPNCTEITGDLHIGGTPDEPSLINDLSPISQLTSIQGKLTISKNDPLSNLSGLENLTTINGDIYIGFNPALSNLANWTNLTSTGGSIIIRHNALNDLTGFDNLTSLGGYLNIGPSSTLTSLSGLDNLTSINGFIYVQNNTVLSDLTGLNNIDYTTIADLKITNNPLLSVCNMSSICNYLENGKTADIDNNASGCNTQIEVKEACDIISSIEISALNKINIYPNPAKGRLYIHTNEQPIEHVLIFDTTGRQFTAQVNNNSIDISTFPSGIYTIKLTVKGEDFYEKIVVE